MGSHPATLVRTLAANGFVPPSRMPHVLLAGVAALLRWPFTRYEQAQVARVQHRVRATMAPPIFIVGHWRCGTTHLYNLLSQSPDFAFVSPFATGLPWEFLSLGAALEPLLERALPAHRFIDRVPVHKNSPQEDEIALANMQPVSFYHGLYFPRHFRKRFYEGIFFEGCRPHQIETWKQCFTTFLVKLALQQPGRQLLIKNPAHSARVALIRELFPQAKFIHIYRNPYRVFISTRRFYWRLFEALALQPYEAAPVDDVILDAYPRMMERLLRDLETLPDSDCVEVRFEDLEVKPLDVCARIYQSLELGDFEKARPHIEAYLAAVQDYQKNTYTYPDDIRERVQTRWGAYIERWGYDTPA